MKNTNISLLLIIENTHGIVSSRHDRDTPHLFLGGDASDLEKRESTREAKTADTHILPSRVNTETSYANLRHQQSHPCIYLRQCRRNEKIALLFLVLFLVRDRAEQCDSLQARLCFQTSPADMAPCRRLMQTDFASCRLRTPIASGTAVQFQLHSNPEART